MYAYIKGEEDGNPVTLLSDSDLQDFLEDPCGYGSVKSFKDAQYLKDNSDPNYWPEGDAVLIKFEVIQPKPVTSKWEI